MGTWLHNNWPKNYHVTHSQWKIMTKWNLQIIYARNLNYSSHWWKKCQLIKIFRINGFEFYQIYIFVETEVFVKNSRSQKSFVAGCGVLESWLFCMKGDDKHGNFTIFVSSSGTHSKCWWTQQQADWLTEWHITLHLQSLQNPLAISWEKFN